MEAGCEYLARHIEYFGEDYVPEPNVQKEHDHAKSHTWYMSSRQITINDLYSFDPDLRVDVEEVTNIGGRNLKQPKEALGFDSSPTVHKWRSINWPNNFL